MTIANSRANENAPNPDSQLLVAGRYRLLEQIGSGRLGDIFAAEDVGRRALGIDEHAAVQLLSDDFAGSSSLVAKLQVGYASLRGAAHPSIVPYLNVGMDGQCGYVVMELLDGLSIRDVLRQSEDLPLDEVLPVVRAVGEALQFLHSQSIVHGKVTPENVFVTGALDVHLLDVIPLSASDTALRGVATALNRKTARDDVFGLACLAYEMLTGRHPFNYRSLPDVLKAGLEPEPIATLSVSHWNSLRRALVANADDSIHNLAEFLQEFGIRGSERLSNASPAEPAARESAVPAPAAHQSAVPTPPARESAIPKSAFGDSLPKPTTMVIDEDDLRAEETTRSGRIRTFVLFALLVALGAWYFYGEPQARAVAALESLLPLSSVPETSMRSVSSPGRSAALAEQPAATVVADEPEIAEALAEAPPETEPTEAPTETLPVQASPGAENESETAEVLAEIPDESPAVEAPGGSGFAFEATVVTVSERDGAARIAVQRSEDPAESASWWVTGRTAVAGADYVDLQGELAGAQADGEASILLIPLVNDATAEAREEFFVHMGLRVSPDGALEVVDTVRVDIIDDD